tara:strand:- start:254 stop:481 length:228 start_codon:yes stop_codon:yes gene_type:complete
LFDAFELDALLIHGIDVELLASVIPHQALNMPQITKTNQPCLVTSEALDQLKYLSATMTVVSMALNHPTTPLVEA